ncbi:MAG: helix-turn-helix transcriptional regulator [Ruminococcaceae bacterium]|nr:helix-turn-helix transcriptional regulator [Oscillospiraceae bacterium]
MESIAIIFGRRVRLYRKLKKLSQEKLAELCELHPVYIGQLERGEKNASLETIVRVSKGLDISPTLLFGEVELEREHTPAQQAYDLFMQTSPDKQQILLELLQKAIELI